MIKKVRCPVIFFVLCISFIFPGVLFKNNQSEFKTFWFNLMLNGKKTGYFSFCQYNKTEGGETFIIREEKTLVKINRYHHVIESHTRSFKKMDSNGRLLCFYYESEQGNSHYEIKGDFDYINGLINITHIRGGSEEVEQLRIIADALTEYQALTHLKNRGWIEGDSISYYNLMTEKASYIKVNMKLEAIEKRIFDAKSEKVYKIVRTIKNIPDVKSITWVDSDLMPYRGELILPQFKYTLKLTTSDDALDALNESLISISLAKLQLKNFSIIGSGNNRDKIKKVKLLIKLKKGESFSYDLNGGIQKIVEGNLTNGLHLIIDTKIPEKLKNTPIISQQAELEPFLRSNAYIESDNDKIINISNKLKVKSSAMETVLKIENWVHNNTLMTFKTGFASALETLNAGEGDCTEHAVLTAALCRASGIPAVVAIGYTLSMEHNKIPIFIGHMWNEVFIGDRWIPIDSTTPGFLPDPFRIRFFSSSLESREIMKTMALFTLTQNLEIRVVDIFPKINKDGKGLKR